MQPSHTGTPPDRVVDSPRHDTAASVSATGQRQPAKALGGRARKLGLGVTGIVLVTLLLEFAVRLGALPSAWFPPPSEILPTFLELVAAGDFFGPVLRTLEGWVLGILAAAAVAIPLGVVIGSVEIAHRMSRFLLEFLRPIPPVALIPAAVLIFGSNLDMKVFLIAFGVFWPILLQTLYGVHDVDPTAQDTGRSYGLSRRAVLTRITLPSAAAYMATGLRIASAIALILALTSEIVVGTPGIGVEIVNAQAAGGAEDLVYAWVFTAGLLGWLLNASLQAVERRMLHWHPSFRGATT